MRTLQYICTSLHLAVYFRYRRSDIAIYRPLMVLSRVCFALAHAKLVNEATLH